MIVLHLKVYLLEGGCDVIVFIFTHFGGCNIKVKKRWSNA